MHYAAVENIISLMGEENVTRVDSGERIQEYLKDMADNPSKPLLVVHPKSTEEVSKVLKIAAGEKIAVVARGAGTSLTGASSSHSGIVMDFSKKMKRILKIDIVNWYVHCEVGVVLDDLNDELQKHGFFFPPDPASAPWCTVGGAIAENSGGMKCFRYGTMKDWVYALKVVFADGSVARLGEALPKNRVGYDLVHLVCGSEGTLALVTEAWLKIVPIPTNYEKRKRLLVYFGDWEKAGNAVRTIRERRIQPILLEFFDWQTIHSVNSAFELGIPEHAATLFVEIDSSLDEFLNICKECEMVDNYVAKDQPDGERLYNARALAYLALKSQGQSLYTEDVVVPIDMLAEYLLFVKQISRKYDLEIPTNGHAGDGNVHPIILYDKSSEESVKKAKAAFGEICNYAIRIGGSVSGEHGIGEQKIEFAETQLRAHNGDRVLELMRKIKSDFDPDNILNPGKFLSNEK